MGFKRYENSSLQHIEALLERLVAHFEKTNEPEDKPLINDIQKNLKKIKEDNGELKGSDFLEV